MHHNRCVKFGYWSGVMQRCFNSAVLSQSQLLLVCAASHVELQHMLSLSKLLLKVVSPETLN